MVQAFNPDDEKIRTNRFENSRMTLQYWELTYHNETVIPS